MEKLAIVDVHYEGERARAACVTAARWEDAVPLKQHTVELEAVAAYAPGEFYKRELPCLLKVLEGVDAEVIVIDGYVFLDEAGRKGLGAHLHDAIGKPVVGVAKTAFNGSPMAQKVLRGTSKRPLYVTQLGVPDAPERVQSMHGASRIPTLIALADALSRRRSPP
jgi:deoxyribonuclease V